jgi:hypothetical protein
MAVYLTKASKHVRNFNAPVRGTDVHCFIGVRKFADKEWCYSLWDSADNLISSGVVDMRGMEHMTPDQFARAMYLCDVIYNTHDNLSNRDFVWTEEIHPDL